MKYLAMLQALGDDPPISQKGMGNPPTEPTELPLRQETDLPTEPTEPTEPVLLVLSVSDPCVSSSEAEHAPPALDTPEPLTYRTYKTSDPSSDDALGSAYYADLDAARNARDQALGRGYDYAWVEDSEEDEIDRLAAADGWKPLPEIPATIDAEITRIEAEALALGWDHGRLWRFEFWPSTANHPRGLASVLEPGGVHWCTPQSGPKYSVMIKPDRIVDVTADFITIEKGDGSATVRFPKA